jgi:hypothetical protein
MEDEPNIMPVAAVTRPHYSLVKDYCVRASFGDLVNYSSHVLQASYWPHGQPVVHWNNHHTMSIAVHNPLEPNSLTYF